MTNKTNIKKNDDLIIKYCRQRFSGGEDAEFIKYHNYLFMISKAYAYFVVDAKIAFTGTECCQLKRDLTIGSYNNDSCICKDRRQCVQRIKEFIRKNEINENILKLKEIAGSYDIKFI